MKGYGRGRHSRVVCPYFVNYSMNTHGGRFWMCERGWGDGWFLLVLPHWCWIHLSLPLCCDLLMAYSSCAQIPISSHPSIFHVEVLFFPRSLSWVVWLYQSQVPCEIKKQGTPCYIAIKNDRTILARSHAKMQGPLNAAGQLCWRRQPSPLSGCVFHS